MATTAELAITKLVVSWAPRFKDAAWFGDGSSDLATFTPGGRLLAFTQAAGRAHDSAAFLGVYYDAMTCWVLHMLTMAEREESTQFGANVAGPVTSIRTGDESIGFQQSAMSVGGGGPSDVFFKETRWGKQYLGYRDTRPSAHLGII